MEPQVSSDFHAVDFVCTIAFVMAAPRHTNEIKADFRLWDIKFGTGDGHTLHDASLHMSQHHKNET